MWADCLNCLIPIGLILIGLTIGIATESAHYKSLIKRELEIKDKIIITNLKHPPEGYRAVSSSLCVGSVVIASDFFKGFVANLIKLVGGRIRVFETLLDRARREALLRAAEQALGDGANMLLNVRFETSTIVRQDNRGGLPSAEVIAYATAVKAVPVTEGEGYGE